MPLIIPKTLPAYDALYEENVFVMHRERAASQHIRPLEILILNLMPTKIATETQIARLLANTPLQVHMTLLQTASHAATHVSAAHLEAFYKTFEEVKNNRYDGMIITGAPVETMDFEQVDYWPELCEIMDFSETNVYSTLHVCWGAQAGLYYHYGVRKHILPEKMFGVFEHKVTRPANPLVRGFDEVFYAPHSRHTGISREDVLNCRALRILAESDEAGPFLMSTENGRQIFVTGHPEYDKYTLDAEYKRDVGKGLPIAVPKNYYPNDDPEQPPLFRWRAHAHLLYENWLNYYVYQNTPYDHLGDVGVDALGTGHVLVSAGGTQRAAQLSAKEPVQHSDQHRAEDGQGQDGVIEGHIADITGRDQQAVLIHADGQVGFAAARAEAHDAEVDRIQRQLGQNTGQNSRDAAGRVEQARNKARQHTCCRSRQQGKPHRHPVKHHNNADRTAGTKRAVDRQIGHIQDAVGQVDADGHNAPDKALGHSTGH